MAVSKGIPAERVAEAVRAGHQLFGENRVQEAEDKAPAVASVVGSAPRWHLVGHLQSNKARRAIRLFDVIQSVDSLELARRLDGLAAEVGPPLQVYLQVNVDRDPAKAGFSPEALRLDLGALLDLASLDVRGLMTVGALVAEPEGARSTFRELAALSAESRERDARLGAGLSMGMSDDFEVAVEEGATCLRIGRAIFGKRRDATEPVP